MKKIYEYWFYKWFTKDWYKYLFEKRPRELYPLPFWKVLWCRYKGHPNGIVFYNAGGEEPDTSCKDCGDEIG